MCNIGHSKMSEILTIFVEALGHHSHLPRIDSFSEAHYKTLEVSFGVGAFIFNWDSYIRR